MSSLTLTNGVTSSFRDRLSDGLSNRVTDLHVYRAGPLGSAKNVYIRNTNVHPSISYIHLSLKGAGGREAGYRSPVNRRPEMYNSAKNMNNPQLILHRAQSTAITPLR